MQKKVAFVLPCMRDGGAEHVATLLANEFYKNGIETSFILTSTGNGDTKRIGLNNDISLRLLNETNENVISKCERKFLRVVSTIVCKLYENTGHVVPANWAYISFFSEYKKEIRELRTILKNDSNLCLIAFLQPSIPIAVLAARGLSNKVIISERGDPQRLMSKRYGQSFIKKYYDNVSVAVFQTHDAQEMYPKNVQEKGMIISNPLKDDLPMPYVGKRNKTITTFCRITAQKNLPMLFEAFRLLHIDHPDYILRVVGNAFTEADKTIELELKQFAVQNNLTDFIRFEPFIADIHATILRDAMYVNSSDYEGISNAMLEALAIGMPVVCTDCPIGGARATIQDGINGLIVPVGDSQAMYRAMKRIVEETKLAESLSKNAFSLRNELKLEIIAEKWMELL